MPDHATSTSTAVQAQLDRLWSLSPGADVLGLERITTLLARLGDPHLRLPPVFHVAGTNGKGSTCAFLRAILEAGGCRVHVYTSPHLVRFNERIRLAGRLIDDDALAALLAEVLDVGGDIGASFFEVTTAAAFLAFSRVPADACVVEVGLGGRLDATNVLHAPIACGIAALGMDHEGFLLAPEPGTPVAPLDRIGFEKAGIAKPGVPLVTLRYPGSVRATIGGVAMRQGAPLIAEGEAWTIAPGPKGMIYTDATGTLALPQPHLPGDHQAGNAGLAIAMLRHQDVVSVQDAAVGTGIRAATWPARLQRLGDGPLTRRLPRDTPAWLDGGHNPSAGEALAAALPRIAGDGLMVIVGMLANKDAAGFLAPFAAQVDAMVAIPVPGHEHHAPEALAQVAKSLGVAQTASAPSIEAAIALLAEVNPLRAVLICGSLYLAGEVLRLNDEAPI